MKRLLFSAFAIAATAAFSASASATTITGVTSSLTAAPTVFNGNCPGVITFNGTITVNGTFDSAANYPDQFGYQFQRSDGAIAPISYFTVHGSGPFTHPVSTTWTLGGAALPHYSGWEQVKVWPTHGGFAYAFSPQAHFTVNCSGGAAPAPAPAPSLTTTLSATPTSYTGVCPAVITFNGTIVVNGTFNSPPPYVDQVGYQFQRSDGAIAPISYFTVHGSGPFTHPVSTTWTLGGAALPSYSGWQRLHVWLTHGGANVTGANANFTVHCLQRPIPPLPGRN
ncbi:MAG: hypothetical protein KGM97_09045 [Alphaproteobacteria bacterium]|nr:hypothetical protein [Alphaproteobacteria bacterium]MDE2631122.1 hypothetical protein [Alphaproteobacteria bacterium]